MQNYRYYLTDQLGTIGTEPLGASDFVITWANEQDGSLRMYTKTFDGNILFTGEAYAQLLRIEKSVYRCNSQFLSIEKRCDNVWQEIFSGSISLNSGEWDEDRCSVKLKFTEVNEASCLSDNDSQELNLLSLPTKYILNTRPSNVNYEFMDYDDADTVFSEPGLDPYWGGGVEPAEGMWNYVRHHQNITRQSGEPASWNNIRKTTWIREVLTVPTGTIPEDEDWVFLETVAGNDKYIRFANLYNYQFNEEITGNTIVYNLTYDYIGKDSAYNALRNGVKLSDVINYFVTELCSGITVKSNFFQINPDNPSDMNYVTGKRTKTANIFLFQASDVKRPIANAMATKMMFDWERLTNALKYMFNVDWRVSNGFLILEHVSFFPKNIGLDLTTEQYAKWLKGKRKYTYKNDDIPSKETWSWATPQSYGDFNGVPIIYNSGCIVNKKIEKPYNIEDVYTDVELAFANPSQDNKNVDDEAIYFIAGGVDGSSYYILQESGILSRPKVNNTLGLAQLHRDYHKYERPLPSGNMNGVLTDFITVKPTKQGEKFKVPICCPNSFNPDDLVKTFMGNGVVNSASFSFKDSNIELELLYDAFENLIPNAEPVAVFDSINTYDQSTILIDVLLNDTYEAGDVIEIVTMPALGTASVVNNKIQFTVNLGTSGNTYMTYRIKDSVWGVYSNTVSVSINIMGANQPPVANPDNYQAVKNELLTVATAQGVLANDSDDYGGLFIFSYDPVGINGGVVNMGSDGSFTYMPVTDYEGSDSFTYTVRDSEGLEDVGTVSISVDAINVPITVNDNYQVQAGAVLNIDNTAGKPSLISNDYTLNSSPVTAIAETVLTSRGVSVNITSSGLFAYNAPATQGDDTFNYTAVSIGGNSIGTATIKVLQLIKIGLRYINQDTVFETIDCEGSTVEGIRRDFGDVEIYFLDEANNPIDVTGLGLRINIKKDFVDELDSSNNSSGIVTYEDNTGTSRVIVNDAVLYYRENDCSDQPVSRYTNSYSMDTGDGYTVI